MRQWDNNDEEYDPVEQVYDNKWDNHTNVEWSFESTTAVDKFYKYLKFKIF